MFEPLGMETLRSRLAEFHELLRLDMPEVTRVGVALRDPASGLLRTYAHRVDAEPRFQVRLVPPGESAAGVPGIHVVDHAADASVPPPWSAPHETAASTCTKAFGREGREGFLFFDAAVPAYFGPERVRRLETMGSHLALVVLHGLDVIRALDAALRTGALLTRFRDVETADHVERVSRYARLLAEAVAPRWGLADETVEAIALFSVAHDIGKVAVPEALLGKHGPLTEDEVTRMKTHTTAGTAIVDNIVLDLGLEEHAHLSVLRNVVRSHHELLDGSGYPDALAGDAIPPEARIVVVADVYDALRSVRTYKDAWSHEETLAYLKEARGRLFEPACVDAAVRNGAAFEEIRRVSGRA